MERKRKWMMAGVVLTAVILFAFVFSWWWYSAYTADYRFTSEEGYDHALNKAREWNDDAFIVGLSSREAKGLDGRNDLWTYIFDSPSTATNASEGENDDRPWRVDRLVVEVTKDGNGFHSKTTLSYQLYSTPNISSEDYGSNMALGSEDVAKLASKTDDYANLTKRSGTVWVDYRLNRNYWTLDISDVRDSPHLNQGLMIVVRIYPDSGRVVSYTEDMELID
ncbi:MAG: hypothetical protein ACMUIE_05975 [Thermoplasmatota archaeon]